MSALCLRLSGTDSISGAPVYVEVINYDLETVAELPLPVNRDRYVEVESGKYFIRARLPSGEIISAQAFVEKNTANKVELPFIQLPDKQLEWQYFLGNINTRTAGLKISQFASIWQRLWSREGETWKLQEWPTKWNLPHDETAINFRLELPHNQLYFLQIGGLQVPWHLIALPPGRHLEVLVHPLGNTSDFGEDIAVAVASLDNPEAETLLSYLTSGSIGAAKVVGDEFDAEKLLYEKHYEPLGAAICGYYLLRVGANERLHNWSNNFVNLIQWLPDAPVIHAWQLLREPEVPRVELARSRLLEAVKRGIPVYTEGLRLLFDGLQLFNQEALVRHEPDAEVEKALEQIRDYAAAADWSKPLTTFYGADPKHPSLSLISGMPEETIGLVWLTEPAIAPEQQSERSPQKILVNLSRWLHNNFDESVQATYQTVEEIFGSRRLIFRSTSSVKRAKLINLGNGSVVALVVEVTPESEDRIGILLRVYALGEQTYLPENLKLSLLFAGKVAREATPKSGENCIQQPLTGSPGDEFGVRVSIGDVSVTEDFVI